MLAAANAATIFGSHRVCHQECHKFSSSWKAIPPAKNYPTLNFMLLAPAAATGVPYTSSPVKYFPVKTYCYFVYAADARSVCDS